MKTFKVYLASYAGNIEVVKQAESIVAKEISALHWPEGIEFPAPRLPEEVIPNSVLIYHTSVGNSGNGVCRKIAPATPIPYSRLRLPANAAPNGLLWEAPGAPDIISAARTLEPPCLMLGVNMAYTTEVFSPGNIGPMISLSIESILHAYYIGADYHRTPLEWVAGAGEETRTAMYRSRVPHEEGNWNVPPRKCELLTSISFNVKERRST